MKTIQAMLDEGMLVPGKKAKENPDSLLWANAAIGIANKDYAAQTPFLWNAVYKELGIGARNMRLVGDPAHAPEIFSTFKGDPMYLGGDVGVGFKDKAWSLLDDIDPAARAMQSVNVVAKTSQGLLKGYNTDGVGYAESLEAILKGHSEGLRGATVVVLGGGGTANSIAFALAMRGAVVVVLNRTVPKAVDLARRTNSFLGIATAYGGGRDELSRFAAKAAAIVSVIDDPESPLDEYSALGTIELPATETNLGKNLEDARRVMALLKPGTVISDVMLRKQQTATLREAAAMGFLVLDGRPMVLNQAIEAFAIVNEQALREKGADRTRVAAIMKEVFVL